MKTKYTVIATSGWQGDWWRVVGYAGTRGEAEVMRHAAAQCDARETGYITAVIGETHFCADHGLGCELGDTSRVKVRAAHLRSRRCHIVNKNP